MLFPELAGKDAGALGKQVSRKGVFLGVFIAKPLRSSPTY